MSREEPQEAAQLRALTCCGAPFPVLVRQTALTAGLLFSSLMS
jgi:hypothetical protein